MIEAGRRHRIASQVSIGRYAARGQTIGRGLTDIRLLWVWQEGCRMLHRNARALQRTTCRLLLLMLWDLAALVLRAKVPYCEVLVFPALPSMDALPGAFLGKG